jgi:hypothetical protein
MSRTSMTQKQYDVSQRNDLMKRFSLENSSLEPSSIIKIMMKIIRTKSKDSMNMETQVQFSKIADAVIRMVEEVRE